MKKILKAVWEWIWIFAVVLYACIFIREGDDEES